MRPLTLASLACAAALACACSSKPKLVNGCSADSDCGDATAWRCDLSTATCLCRTSDACPAGQTCNVQGYCQAKIGCYETLDCPVRFFCDPSTNLCLADGSCASDLDCAAGQLCDAASQTCKAGCRVDGDCGLREVCLCPAQGDGGATEDLCGCDGSDGGTAACPVGRCASGLCRDDGACDWGYVCATPPGGGLKVCLNDYDTRLRPYCANCVDIPGQDTCGAGANFCLYSTYTQTTYCGVDCSDGQHCPNGYDCKNVIVVWTRTACTAPDQCTTPDHRSSLACQTDADCPNNGLCGHDPGAPVGFCYGDCKKHEGANMSFCACVADEDCAQDSCVAESQTCSISRKICDPNGNGCFKTRCVQFNGTGGCVIGQNCKPLEGLTCADVQPN
jgi:hypothetical protein